MKDTKFKIGHIPWNKNKQFCINGHEIAIVGRTKGGHCKACKKRWRDSNKEYFSVYQKKYQRENREKIKETDKIYYEEHKEEIRIKTKEYNDTHKKQRRNRDLLKKYGITLEQYDKMFKKQKGFCIGCLRHQDVLKKVLAVDHNHKTGKVRGLLCDTCNRAIGLLQDDIKILVRLMRHLNKNKEK